MVNLKIQINVQAYVRILAIEMESCKQVKKSVMTAILKITLGNALDGLFDMAGEGNERIFDEFNPRSEIPTPIDASIYCRVSHCSENVSERNRVIHHGWSRFYKCALMLLWCLSISRLILVSV